MNYMKWKDITYLANSVVASGIVIGGVLLACEKLLWVEQLPVHASPDFV